jgi:membrane protease YdiL (CAAX protease family)
LQLFVLLFGLFALAFFGACLFGWVVLASLWGNGARFVPQPETRTEARWGLLDLIAVLFLIFLAQLLGLGLAKLLGIGDLSAATGAGKLDIRVNAWVLSFHLLAMLLSTLWICARCRVGFSQVGWSMHRMGKDVALGLAATILFVPPIYVLMFALTSWLQHDYDHPIFEMVGNDLWLLGLAAWMAVGVAPITEEYLFRVLLQGYLEAMAKQPLTAREVFLGRSMTAPPENASTTMPSSTLSKADATWNENPYQSTMVIAMEADAAPINSEADGIMPDAKESPVVPWWPVIVTGILFGLAHFDFGVSWIPLVLMGWVLGWLYRMTHRIWPSLIVHVLLNSISLAGLGAKILSGGAS